NGAQFITSPNAIHAPQDQSTSAYGCKVGTGRENMRVPGDVERSGPGALAVAHLYEHARPGARHHPGSRRGPTPTPGDGISLTTTVARRPGASLAPGGRLGPPPVP